MWDVGCAMCGVQCAMEDEVWRMWEGGATRQGEFGAIR